MGTELNRISHDELFRNARDFVILNDLYPVTTKDRERLDALTHRELVGDAMDMTPSCACGHLKRNVNLGQTCPKCMTVVTAHRNEKIDPICWVRAPRDVVGIINPLLLMQLRSIFKKGEFNVIDWLIRPGYTVDKRTELIREQVTTAGVTRGYNELAGDMIGTVEKLATVKAFRTQSARAKILALLESMRIDKDKLVSQYLPFLNRSLLVVEANNNDKYVDPVIADAIDAIRSITGIDHPDAGYTAQVRENRTASMLITLAGFYTRLVKEVIQPKPGILRRNVFGTRGHFTLRCVISSITEPHQYDDLHLPWVPSVVMYGLHLTNKLMNKHGLSAIEAKTRLNQAMSEYDPLIDQLFNELIAEGPGGRLWVTIGRNPSLKQASLQLFAVGKFKRDITDNTIGLPITMTPGFNADFDGDQMNVGMVIDKYMLSLLMPLAPHCNLPNINDGGTFSPVMTIPKPVVGTVNSFLQHPSAYYTPEQQAFLESLA